MKDYSFESRRGISLSSLQQLRIFSIFACLIAVKLLGPNKCFEYEPRSVSETKTVYIDKNQFFFFPLLFYLG